MNCVCGCPVTDHAKVYDCNYAQWTPALPFTLSGRCLKCVDGGCPGFMSAADAPHLEPWPEGAITRAWNLASLHPLGAFDRGRPAEAEWWKKYDRPQSAGRPEVM